jgi:hypothetical protein
MKWGRKVACAVALLALATGIVMSSCGGGLSGRSAVDGGDDASPICPYGGCATSDSEGVPPTTTDANVGCPGETTISGKVYDPASKNPLYNVLVETPAATPIDLSMAQQGASCAACTSLYTTAIAYAYTDETGSFTIHHAAHDPPGGTTTLIVQIG